MTVTDGNLKKGNSKPYAEGMNICVWYSTLIFQFVLSSHSTEQHHLSRRRPLASTPPTGKVPLRTDGTPDLQASGTGPDLQFSSQSNRKFQQYHWVSVSKLILLLQAVCQNIYVLYFFVIKKICLFFEFILNRDKKDKLYFSASYNKYHSFF